jgi:galactokinase/mevalonate kinase-like predicted kinase
VLTTRDLEIIDFLKQFKIAPTNAISELFFKGCLSAAQRRLKYLYSKKAVNRIREIKDSINSEYLYYVKFTDQVKHAVTIVNFYVVFRRKYEVIKFIVQPKLGSIIPDALIAYKDKIKGNGYISCLEVEISHKAVNIEKYKLYQSSGEYKKYFPAMPGIIIVTNKRDIVKENTLDITYYNLEGLNI